MKEPLYSTKQLAIYFNKKVDWVHQIVYEFKIKPHRKEKIPGHVNAMNFYTRAQRDEIEKRYHARLEKSYRKVIYVEQIYVIAPSKMNDSPDL